MPRKSLQKNYIFNLAYQALLLITPLITTPHLSRTLGAHGIGLASYAGSIVSCFVLFATMGITIYGQREISYAQDAPEKQRQVFWNVKVFSFCTTALAFCVYLPFSLGQPQPEIYLMYGFQLLSVVFDVTWFFQGMEQFGTVLLWNTGFRLIGIVYLFLAVRTSGDILAYIFHLSGLTCLSHLSLWIMLPANLRKPDLKNLHPFRCLPVILSLFAPTIAIQVYTVLDKTMIGLITGSTFQNGYYEQALKVSHMALTIVTALGTVMVPRIGYHYEQGEQAEITRLIYGAYRFVWLLGIPLCFGLSLIAENLVPWFFGAGYEPVIPLLKILALLIPAIGISNVTGIQYLVPTRQQHLLTASVMIGAGLNFILNLFLIRRWGALGAALATVAAEITISVVQLFFVRRELSAVRILKEGRHYLLAGLGMTLGVAWLGHLLPPAPLHTAAMILSGATIYAVLLWMLQDDFVLSCLKMIRNRIRK